MHWAGVLRSSARKPHTRLFFKGYMSLAHARQHHSLLGEHSRPSFHSLAALCLVPSYLPTFTFSDLDRAQPIFAYDFRLEHEVLDAQKRSKEETAELEKERGERAEMRERLEAEREGRREKEEQARQEADKERHEAERQRLEQERLEQDRQAVEQRKAEERRAGRVKEMERNREMQKDLKLKEQIRQMANFCPGITPDQSKFLLESYVRPFASDVEERTGRWGAEQRVCVHVCVRV